MQIPYISIIILHYKNLSDTRECLKSLQKLDYERFNVILVNNDSLEHKDSLEREFNDFVKIIQNEKNLGFAEGNNVGIQVALEDQQTDAVLLLNNDTVVEPNFLSEMLKIKADMISPQMIDYNDHNKIDNLGIVLMTSGLPFNRTNENQKLFCPSGGCALYTRKLLEDVATPSRHSEFVSESTSSKNKILNQVQDDVCYFDPTYFAYCEDLDLGWRARNKGFEAGYSTKAIVYHKGSSIHGKLSDFAIYHTYRNLLWTQFKNMPFELLLWQCPWFFAGCIFIFFYYILKAKSILIIKTILHGLIGIISRFNSRSKNLKNKTASNKKILSLLETGLFPKNLIK